MVVISLSLLEVLLVVISLSLLGTRGNFFFFFCQLVYSWELHFVSGKLLGLNNPLVTEMCQFYWSASEGGWYENPVHSQHYSIVYQEFIFQSFIILDFRTGPPISFYCCNKSLHLRIYFGSLLVCCSCSHFQGMSCRVRRRNGTVIVT